MLNIKSTLFRSVLSDALLELVDCITLSAKSACKVGGWSPLAEIFKFDEITSMSNMSNNSSVVAHFRRLSILKRDMPTNIKQSIWRWLVRSLRAASFNAVSNSDFTISELSKEFILTKYPMEQSKSNSEGPVASNLPKARVQS
jgi:hypothetical protein